MKEIKKLIDSERLEEAELALSDAIKQNPDSTELLNLQAELKLKMGSIYWEKGDVETALEYLTKALEINPFGRNTVLKCGEVLTALEQNDIAKKLYSSYLQRNPDDEEVAQALNSLDVKTLSETKSPEMIKQADEKSGIKVSAIVSTYNSEKFIRGCLEDLVNQTLFQKGELEIVVVDSGSQQNEKAIVGEFRQKYKNIKYIRTKERETVYAAWNRGIKAASGKYVTNANTDDRHRKDALEVMAKELDDDPNVILVYADVFVTNFPCESFANHIRCGYHIRPDYSPDIMLSGCHMGPQPMWRKSVHGEIGYFNTSSKSAGDYEMWCRIATRYPMKHIQEFFGVYYENPEGFCNIDKELSFRETAMIQQMYRSQFPHPKPLSEYINNYQFMEYVSPHKYANICMVTYNRLNFTRQAIDGLIKFTRYPHVITVVDNNSQDGIKEYLQELHRKGIIKNLVLLNKNIGVAKASNLAWHLGPDAEYYIKFDNDIVIQKPDWLDEMVKVIEAVPEIGVLGYNFEPFSYPIVNVNGYKIRPKKANIGGACCLIPRRTWKRLGYWFEDYGLYSEEDADYGLRIQLAGLMNAYMEDEGIGIHLPAGKAAFINPYSLTAEDGVEEIEDVSYRQWKDEQRRKVVCSHTFNNQMNGYINGTIPLYVESRFAKGFIRERNS